MITCPECHSDQNEKSGDGACYCTACGLVLSDEYD